MKTRRQMRILGIINHQNITTQQELVQALEQEGLDVTQATVSRDIKELGLVKTPMEDGRYRYRESSALKKAEINEQLLLTLQHSIISMDFSESMLVINTLPATAQAVAEAIDAFNWSEVVGTLAGERTVFAVIKPVERMMDVIERIRRFSRKGSR